MSKKCDVCGKQPTFGNNVARLGKGAMIRVQLPHHLQNLARVPFEVAVDVQGQPTLSSVLDALEVRFPVLRGTIRDQVTRERRSLVRFYACEQDWSHEAPDTPLPAPIAAGTEPLLVVGAMAGG